MLVDVSNFGMVAGRPTKQEISTASGAGGNVTVNLRPPVNTIWIPTLIVGFQDEGALVMDWCLMDGGGVIVQFSTTGANVYKYFYQDCPMAHPLVLTNSQYLYLLVIGMAAGKNAHIKAWVHAITGVPSP
jgi:hypothetical protein